MKKIISITLTTLVMLSLLLLSGCDIYDTKDGTTHTHEFGEWKVTKEATCTEDGSKVRTCECGESEEEVIAAIGHTEETLEATFPTCTESGLTEGKRCSLCGEVTVKQENIAALGHQETILECVEATCIKDGLTEGKQCTVCGEITLKQKKLSRLWHSFKYHSELDESGNEIFIGVCQRDGCEERISREMLPGLYNSNDQLLASWDELVNVYGLNSLGTNENLISGTTLIFDDSVTAIYLELFEDCPNITTIIIPAGVTNISNSSLRNPIYLKNIIVDEDNQQYKSIDGNLYTKDSKILVQYAVGKEDKEFTIPDGVTRIGYLAFGFCNEIENVVIPSSVTQIDASIFYSCASLKNIYFNGTAEEWDDIKYKTNWLPYNALVHYDGNKMFMAYGFAGDFGSSGASGLCQIITIRNNQINIGAHGYDVLYDTTTRNDSYQFEYGDRIYSYIENRKEPEKLAVLDQIKACDQFYILEGTDKNGDLQKRICCYIDGIFYLLTVSDTNEEIGVPIINRINYAIFEWKE